MISKVLCEFYLFTSVFRGPLQEVDEVPKDVVGQIMLLLRINSIQYPSVKTVKSLFNTSNINPTIHGFVNTCSGWW